MQELQWIFDYSNGKLLGLLKGALDYENPGGMFRRTRKDGQTNTERETAFRLTASDKEIVPDGRSQATLTATLYDFISGQENSSRPLVGKTVEFNIMPLEGLVPGTLSSIHAVTDSNGEATITFTAPNAETLARIEKYTQKHAAVRARTSEADHEELVSIYFKSGNGKILAHPSPGIGSSTCLIPPDKRYPALIEAYFEDGDGMPLTNEVVSFSISGEKPMGYLRNFTGQEGNSIQVNTDDKGFAQVHYCYNASSLPEKPVSEHIHAVSKTAGLSMTATVSIGLNLIFEEVESAFEGKGLVNAGENIPLRIKIKDAWNPHADLGEIINFWGTGATSGDHMLFVKLEIEKLGSVPDYLLDHLQIEKYPEEMFSDFMTVRSFKEKDRMNMLWMSGTTLEDYQGYPRISPQASGKSYYEARIALTDIHGKVVFPSEHPAAKAFLTLETGINADQLKIFVNLNPFAPQTKNQQILREALAYKYGTVVSITDALDAINRGDVDQLYRLLFGEIKSAILEKVSDYSVNNKEAVETYTQLSLAEKLQCDILHDESGPLAHMDEKVYGQLRSAFSDLNSRLIILSGEGDQQLLIEKSGSGNSGKSKVKFSLGGLDAKTEESINKFGNALKKKGKKVPLKEGGFVFDPGLNSYSLKKGNLSYYMIPADCSISHENTQWVKEF
jgi:hypothetical protein